MIETFDSGPSMPTVDRLRNELRTKLTEVGDFLEAKKPQSVFQQEIFEQLSKTAVGISEALDNVSVSEEDNELRPREVRALRENLDALNAALKSAREAFTHNG